MFAAARPTRWARPPLGGVDPDDLTDEDSCGACSATRRFDADDVFAAGPHGIDVPVEHGWVHDELLPDGRWSIAPAELVAASARPRRARPSRRRSCSSRDGEMAWSNSVRYGSGDEPELRAHPDDARLARGVTDGAHVLVTGDHGSVETVLTFDETLAARRRVDDPRARRPESRRAREHPGRRRPDHRDAAGIGSPGRRSARLTSVSAASTHRGQRRARRRPGLRAPRRR